MKDFSLGSAGFGFYGETLAYLSLEAYIKNE